MEKFIMIVITAFVIGGAVFVFTNLIDEHTKFIYNCAEMCQGKKVSDCARKYLDGKNVIYAICRDKENNYSLVIR